MPQCEYTVTFSDFNHSLAAYRKVSRLAFISYLASVWIWPAVALCAGFFGIFLAQLSGESGSYLIVSGFGVALLLPLVYRLRMRYAFRQRNLLARSRPMIFEFDEDTTHFRVPGAIDITYPWGSFSHVVDGQEVVTLIIKGAMFHTIPKRAMPESQWAEVRRLVAAKVRTQGC